MIREPVSSSSIVSIGYDVSAQVLEVEFRNGGIYCYFGVPETVYRALAGASSPGAWFQKRIRDQYECAKVDLEE